MHTIFFIVNFLLRYYPHHINSWFFVCEMAHCVRKFFSGGSRCRCDVTVRSVPRESQYGRPQAFLTAPKRSRSEKVLPRVLLLPLAFGQGLQVGTAQVVGNQRGEFFFLGGRGEFLHDGATRGVGDVRLHLRAQGAFADGREAFAQRIEVGAAVNWARKLSRSPKTRPSMMLTRP